ncbi:hypothetical protein B0H34DRAFT_678723 [Crassisporium funariophilum]|nr:hypothetical protein B0H34DRAFT_678723 [Crassisporium funariophilum]
MAAIVERLMAPFRDPQPSMPRSRRDSVEIIDVDELDFLGHGPTSSEASSSSAMPRPLGVARPRQRAQNDHPETISLLDSDDEEPATVSSSSQARYDQRRRIFSPPPPHNLPQVVIPPVPQVPPRFAGHTSFPMRRRPPPFPSPPVIRPFEQPFPFEVALNPPAAGPSNPRRREPSPAVAPPQAAPPSHSLPPMGLGGALISTYRAQAIPESSQAARGTRRYARVNHMDYHPEDFAEDLDLPHIQTFFGAGRADERMYLAALRDLNHRRRTLDAREKEQYTPAYTHPGPAEAGFTYDFALPDSPTAETFRARLFPPTSIHNPIVLDDEDEDERSASKSTQVAGPSSSSAARTASPAPGTLSALLVCARCCDPLLLNAGLNPDESDRRVWGLRCGHIIDEKCLNELGQPPTVDYSELSGKAKGKAKAVEGLSYDSASDHHQLVLHAQEQNSMRSRLRSRPGVSAPAMATSPENHPGMPPPAKRRRLSSKKSKIEAEYEWRCPVESCQKAHVSVKMAGIWGPEKERSGKPTEVVGGYGLGPRGAIAIFA